MLWRLFTGFIITFWLVMTVLLVRVTYYPEGSQFAKVPPSTIFKMFSERGSDPLPVHIYHGAKKTGYASVTLHRVKPEDGTGDYVVTIQATLDRGGLDFVDSQVVGNLNLEMHGMERWGGMHGFLRMPDVRTAFDFNWPENESLPKFNLRTGGTTLDDKVLRVMMPFMAGPDGVHPPPGVNLPTIDPQSSLQLTAREGVMTLAGQKRHGYVMELAIMDKRRAKAFFTEAGDLALVEMPDGWRALNPVIYNLLPEILDDQE
jgi:hypothetical protein